MTDYSTLKPQLETRRSELRDRLERIKRDVSKSHSSDWSEQAQERENDEVLNQLGDECEREISDINAALLRMEAGEYGICQKCGVDIPLARLQVKPDALNCVDCAE